ncbi:MAG TPA: NAD-dependent dehydratase [Rhodospirillaceae bacterium]|nr:NAD-dependent dehydratase [Rhodospirillaceae bacterium]|tara:strand:+ start:15583 stop:16593 length:1011 start_codon:yes stop_codon:yes gene_type:complete
MTPSRKRILVTGADGFIGSHLTEALVRRGHDVRAFVYYNSFNSWGWLDHADQDVKDAIDVFAGDVRDAHGMRQAMDGRDVVLHLAALIAIPYSYHSPATYVETNIQGTLNVLQAAADRGGVHVVHTSTSEVYGTAQFVPITEDHPLQAQSPYSATKIAADQMALAFHRSFETPVAVLRPFNTYGPRQSARAVLPTIITQALSGQPRLRLGDLHPTRDFTFVSDTVRAFVMMAESGLGLGEVINTGSNFEISIGDAVKAIAEVTGSPLEVETDEQRRRPEKSEVERLWADNTKAREVLGWVPEYGGLDGFKRGIAETVDWFRRSGHIARYKADRYNV